MPAAEAWNATLKGVREIKHFPNGPCPNAAANHAILLTCERGSIPSGRVNDA